MRSTFHHILRLCKHGQIAGKIAGLKSAYFRIEASMAILFILVAPFKLGSRCKRFGGKVPRTLQSAARAIALFMKLRINLAGRIVEVQL
jgi:hypothetical protein